MTRRTLPGLLADGFQRLASEARVPSDAADRALARARRRRVAMGFGGVAAVAAASLVVVLAVARPAPVATENGSGAASCPAALVGSYLVEANDGSAPTAYAYDWQAERCGQFTKTRYAWAVDNDGVLAVLGKAGDTRGRVSDATRKLGILDRTQHTERWLTLPAPAWAAFWSPDHGSKILASLVRREPGGGIDFRGYVVIDPRAGEVTRTVTVDEPALTPFQWTPDSRHVVAAFEDGIRFFDLRGRKTRKLSVQGLIPMPAPVSPDGERILVQRREHVGSGRYLIVSTTGGAVVDRVNVDGTVLGWLGRDALLRVEHNEEATTLFPVDLVPPRGDQGPLKVLSPRADRVVPRLDMLYEDPGPPPQSPGIDPEDVGTTPPGAR